MTAYRAAKGIRKTLFLGIILLGLGQGLFSQNSANSQEAPLVTRGDFVLRGSVLVKYTGNGGAVVIPGNLGITEIADFALSSYGITSVTIPEGVKILGQAFATGEEVTLREVRLPASLTTLADRAFAGCGLTSVVIPSSVVSIGDRAFYGCDGLTSVVIPNSVVSIGDRAFYSCEKLTSVVIPANVNVGYHNSFDEAYIENGKKAGTYSKNGTTWDYTP